MSTDPGDQGAVGDLDAIVRRTRQDPRLARVRAVTIDGDSRPITLIVKVRRKWWRTVDVQFVFSDGIPTLDVERAIESAAWGAR